MVGERGQFTIWRIWAICSLSRTLGIVGTGPQYGNGVQVRRSNVAAGVGGRQQKLSWCEAESREQALKPQGKVRVAV